VILRALSGQMSVVKLAPAAPSASVSSATAAVPVTSRPESPDSQSNRLTVSDDRSRISAPLVLCGSNLQESIAQWRSLHMRRLISGELRLTFKEANEHGRRRTTMPTISTCIIFSPLHCFSLDCSLNLFYLTISCTSGYL
jgi:hypothetical protein